MSKQETKKEPKSFARRDKLVDIEKTVQQRWAERKIYERDAPAKYDPSNKKKFMATFPYPYMNGKLHLGHAFSLSKAEFSTRFHRLNGEDVLFPFGFHCTGMPIAACADKLKKEMALYGNPPDFSKATTKQTGLYQWQIMKAMGFPDDEIAKFADAKYWLHYFPPLAEVDLKRLGVAVDFRRSFITTEINPFYDSFIRWQFDILNEKKKLSFGNRYSIFSPVDNQVCADHDRASGEGVKHKDFTIVKLRILEDAQGQLPEVLRPLARAGRTFYLAAATMRPETMYGQTNCWLLPEGEYGAYELHADGNEVFVMSENAAYNLSFQGFAPEQGKPRCLAKFQGQQLMGAALKAPLTSFEKIHVLPLLTIDMTKTTGVVTSVPSDSPDDFAAFMDIKNKAPLRAKYGIQDDQVLPYDVVPIIDIEGYGDKIAPTLCEQLKIKSQNDKVKLTEAKDIAYKKGFESGIMKVGPHAGKPVRIVKDLIRDELIAQQLALPYSEPENEVISRSGCKCVVALVPQWCITYGEDSWRHRVETHLKNPEAFHYYNIQTYHELMDTVGWLKEWGCSRSYGLGTKFPNDPQYLIESLSDSTIYMAYYTIAHLLQEGDLEGTKPNKLGIKPEQLTRKVWDYIFFKDAAFPADTTIPREALDKLRHEFHYWYPFDVRVSGKDLIKNHLTMSLYNHAAIWEDEPDKWPRSIFANGWILVNGEKMSKSAGNFHTIQDIIEAYGADAVRLTLSDSGDTHDDANFAETTANSAILRIFNHVQWVEEMVKEKAEGKLRKGGEATYSDRVFESRINKSIKEGHEFYSKMQYKEALRVCFYDFEIARDDYRLECADAGVPMREDLVFKWIEAHSLMMYPIIPHICDHIYVDLLKTPGVASIYDAAWPEQTAAGVDENILREYQFFHDQLHEFRARQQKEMKKKTFQIESAYLYIADEYLEWQKQVLSALRKVQAEKGSVSDMNAIAAELKTAITDKKQMKNAMTFAAQIQNELPKLGVEKALSDELNMDEKAIFARHLKFMEQQLNVPEGQLHIQTIRGATGPDPQNRRALVSPSNPQIVYVPKA